MRSPLAAVLSLLLALVAQTTIAQPAAWLDGAAKQATAALVTAHGEAVRPRAERGVRQVANLWRADDGDAAAFEAFVQQNFAGDEARRDAMFSRFDGLLEQLDGSLLDMLLAFRWQTDLDLGPIEPFDELFAGYDPGAHVNDDFFANKIAFVALLNFPLTTLDERLRDGTELDAPAVGRGAPRRALREAHPGRGDRSRSPTANAAADSYIAGYNIWMHHLLDERGKRLFPAGKRLLTHWNLRDELKAQLRATRTDCPAKQRMIAQVMERIVTQTIPAVVIDNPHVDWNPLTNAVSAGRGAGQRPADAGRTHVTARPRARHALRACCSTSSAPPRLADPYSPAAPTLIARRFEEDRELPEARVEAMLVEVLSSPLVPRVAALIETRLGRPLEPFDIWYNGFQPRGAYTEAELDAIVAAQVPDRGRVRRATCRTSCASSASRAERAKYLSRAHRGRSGARRGPRLGRGAARRQGAPADARRQGRHGLQGLQHRGPRARPQRRAGVLAQRRATTRCCSGVPNTAFTEALAFVFQDARPRAARPLEARRDDRRAMACWTTSGARYEIAGVALVDMRVWRWMYEHPEATPAELREATLQIARDVWNRYFAPVFGRRDVMLLAVYSHMISSGLYLPDYPIGAMIALQIEEQMRRKGDLGGEFERMTRQGRLTPDLWMKHATGAPVGPAALLAATEEALATVKGR